MKRLLVFLAILSGLAAVPAMAELKVFACEPEWGALVQELGGDRATVYVATNALQDPHRIEAKPSLLARARRAQLVVCTGAELEIGWLPIVLRQSGNSTVQPDKPGYFEAANYVQKLEVPTHLDRAEGDVHAAGNPHIQTDPRNILRVAAPLSARLAELDPANAATYAARLKAFTDKWTAAIARWEQQGASLRGVPIVVQHKSFSYLIAWLGINEVAVLEPKPGVEPTTAYLAEVLATLSKHPPKMVIRAAYQSDRASQWIAERAKINAVLLPFTVGGTAEARDLYTMFDDTIARLRKGAQ